jgi:hypothetical protein
MRLAIQISGEFRALPYCIHALNKHVLGVFPNAEIDFFIHTWRRDEDGKGTWKFEGCEDCHEQVLVYSHGTGLAVFKPRSYFMENYEDRHDLKAIPRAYSMFYSIKRANDARKEYERLTETTYDLVMRYRTDCILNENLYDMLKPYLEEKKPFLCIPKAKLPKNPDGPSDNPEECICDWFGIGTPDLMDIYCGTYDTWRPLGLPMLPESMLAMQLKSHGITKDTTLKRPPFDFFLIEGNGMIRGL